MAQEAPAVKNHINHNGCFARHQPYDLARSAHALPEVDFCSGPGFNGRDCIAHARNARRAGAFDLYIGFIGKACTSVVEHIIPFSGFAQNFKFFPLFQRCKHASARCGRFVPEIEFSRGRTCCKLDSFPGGRFALRRGTAALRRDAARAFLALRNHLHIFCVKVSARAVIFSRIPAV